MHYCLMTGDSYGRTWCGKLKNKLSQSSVLCIQQDKSGFMWFGTKDGLNRYDGSNFRTFKYDHKNPQSLGNNAINSRSAGPVRYGAVKPR